MNKPEAKKRIEKLKKLINHHRYLYHVLDKQEISDAALDSLKHELYQLEQKYPEFITPDSPTQRIAGKASIGFKKVAHKVPMLSIEDIFSEDELKKWQDYLKRLAPTEELEYFAELKIDGFAISLIYKKGILVCGSTRGNGKVGEDVTQNLKTIDSIPLRLQDPTLHSPVQGRVLNKLKDEVEIRGEVYMEKIAFEKLNIQLKKQGKKTYANPRNLAAGSIRQLNPKLAADRPLKFLAYELTTDLGQKKHSQEHQILPGLGFKTNQGKVCKDLDEIVDYWRQTAKKRETLPFQIDGLVININDNALFEKLGIAGKSHRAARAFKFSPKQATTKIKKIIVQVGRTGAITPVAILEPVEIGGTLISRATLHNEDQVKRLGVKINDTVIIERAGDVIPAITKVLTELRSGKESVFPFPKKCPVCQTRLIKSRGEIVWRCPNLNCLARKRQFFYHFTSKKGFDIKGLGPKIIKKLIDENLISNIQDIYELKQGDLIPLEKFAQQSAKNLVSAIQHSKKIHLDKFIYALSISEVGEETAIDLANYFGCLTKLSNATKEELEKICDIGPETSRAIEHWFHQQKNLKIIDDLMKAGIKIVKPAFGSTKSAYGQTKSARFENKTFVLTGSLETMTRDRAKEKIRFLGGDISESISAKTDYLVVGKEPGSKLKKAKDLGVKIINEKEFLEIIK